MIQDVLAEHPGRVARQDVKALGMAVVELGGGRRRAGDAIALGAKDLAPGGAAHCLAVVPDQAWMGIDAS